MINILFLIGTLGAGGAEKVLIDTVNNMDKTKYQITLQTIFNEGVHIDELSSDINYKTIISLKSNLLKKIIYNFIQHLTPVRFLYKYFVAGDYDFEVAFLEGIPTKIIAASTKNSIKYSWVHTNFLNNFDSSKYFKSKKHCLDCYKKYDKIICVSEEVKKGFIERLGAFATLDVLYNPINDEKIIHLANEDTVIGWDHEIINFVSVGRLVSQKGYDRLIKVAFKIKEDGYKFKIYILGEGNDRESLEKSIYNLDLSNSIELLGFVKNPYPYIKKADMFICSSRVEGFSTAVTESLILGTPVVTTNCSGMKEIFGGKKAGIIVDNDDASLYQGMKDILINRNLIIEYRLEAIESGNMFKLYQQIGELQKLFWEAKA